jgi:soluble lytic murein transglycosylase
MRREVAALQMVAYVLGIRMKAVLSLFVLAAMPTTIAAQAVPERLALLSHAYLDTHSSDSEFQLREYGAKTAGDAGALAYFVLGYAQWQDKHFSEAAQYLRLARVVPTSLADYADYYLVSALQNSGDHAGALAVLDGFETRHPGSSLTTRAWYAQSVALEATGSPAKAIDLLSAHFDSAPHPAADLLLAKADTAAGQTAQAMSAYADLYYRYPASSEAEEAAKYKADFPKPTHGQISGRAERLVAAAPSKPALQRGKMYLEAEADYKTLAASTKGAEHDNAEVAAAMVLYKMGRTPQARIALGSVDLASPDADAERLYWLTECNRRLKREADMDVELRQLKKRYPSSPWLEEALYSLGNYELIHSGMTAAAQYYDDLAQRFPDGKYASQSHWKVAWSRYRAGDYDAARASMDEQIRKYPASPLAVAAIYWSGRLRETNEKSGAQAYYRRAVEGFPSNFYGFLARERLTVPVSHLGGPYVAPAVPADAGFRRQQFALMRALGLLDLEGAEIRQVLPARGREKEQPFWYLELADVERERGRYFVALDAARRAIANYTQLDPNSIPRPVWELLYPLPWWQEVRDEAAAEDLDPYLVAAVIRQESAFNERAISRTNAYGLMQIEPRTGKELARRLQVAGYSTNSLFIPKVNIRMGVHYLKGLIADNGGRVEDALAAYNAGPDRVVNWRHAGFSDVDEFVESIPFSETREYVQIVLRNAAIYKRLYGGAKASPSAAEGRGNEDRQKQPPMNADKRR